MLYRPKDRYSTPQNQTARHHVVPSAVHIHRSRVRVEGAGALDSCIVNRVQFVSGVGRIQEPGASPTRLGTLTKLLYIREVVDEHLIYLLRRTGDRDVRTKEGFVQSMQRKDKLSLVGRTHTYSSESGAPIEDGSLSQKEALSK